MESVVISPHEFGFPVERNRQYCLCLREDIKLLVVSISVLFWGDRGDGTGY